MLWSPQEPKWSLLMMLQLTIAWTSLIFSLTSINGVISSCHTIYPISVMNIWASMFSRIVFRLISPKPGVQSMEDKYTWVFTCTYILMTNLERNAEVLDKSITHWLRKPLPLFESEPIMNLSRPNEIVEHMLGNGTHVLQHGIWNHSKHYHLSIVYVVIYLQFRFETWFLELGGQVMWVVWYGDSSQLHCHKILIRPPCS